MPPLLPLRILFDKQNRLALHRDIHIAVLGGSGKIKQIHALNDKKPIDVVLSDLLLDLQPAPFNFRCRYFVRICEFHFANEVIVHRRDAKDAAGKFFNAFR